MKEEALAYAAAGYPVIWIYGMERIDETGELSCTCPVAKAKGGGDCGYNQGKHAPFRSDIEARIRDGRTTGGSTGHGAKDATTDPAIIETFPWDENCNFGIVGRDSYPIIDIDDPEITQMLLDPAVGLRDLCTAATTGRGLHAFVQSALTKSCILYRKDTGARIGELRANNQYVVGVPSLHWTGKRYQWLGQSIADEVPKVQTDGYGYVNEILSWIGLELADKAAYRQVSPLDGPILETVELPFASDSTMLTVMLSPGFVPEKRHVDLFHLGCELVREARREKYEGGLQPLAGILKHVDKLRARNHPEGAKFANRDNADDCYWDAINKAAQAVDDEEAKTAAAVTDAGDDTTGTYYYTEDPPMFVDNRNPKARKRLANFETVIDERILYWQGEAEEPTEETWQVQRRQGTEVLRPVYVEPDDYAEPPRFAKAVRKKLPPHFIISNRSIGDWIEAIQYYSTAKLKGPAPVRLAYGASGWLADRDAYLIPGLPGAITADGYDASVTFEPPPAAPKEMSMQRTIAPDADLTEVARTLFTSAPERIIVPLMAQIIAAPLASVGFKNRTIVHLHGPTNSYKTSLASAAFGLYGWVDNPVALGIKSWNADTIGVIRTIPYYFRDMPVLLDDFKAGTHPDRDINALIQSYGDTRGRGRLSRTLEVSTGKEPRGLIVSTGEDVWEKQRSTNTRSLFIRVEDGTMQLSKLIVLDALARSGELGALGVSWIRWLTQRGKEALTTYLREEQLALQPGIEKQIGKEHPRIVSSFTSLFVASKLFSEFVRDVIPMFYDEYENIRKTGWTWQLGASKQQAESSLEQSPLEQILVAIREAVQFGNASFQPKTAADEWLGTQGSEVIGYATLTHIYISEWSTFGWFAGERRRRGEPVGFGWEQVKDAAKTRFGSGNDPEYIAGLSQRKRMVRIPISVILPQEDADVVTRGDAASEFSRNEPAEAENE